MTKRLFVVILSVLFVLGAAPSFAGGGGEGAQAPAQKTVFQLFADGISGTDISGQKTNATGLFQKSSDYIQRTFPDQKPKSLRGNPDEIARRRGIR